MEKTRFFIHSIPFTVLVLAVLVMLPNSAFAQEASEEQANEAIEEIVKVEVLVTSRFLGRHDERAAKTKIYELKRTVLFTDLDLRQESDVDKLNERIENTAEESCKTLSETHPVQLWSPADHRRCVREAIESTEADLETIFVALR